MLVKIGIFLITACVSGIYTSPKRPNIVFVLVDDLGWNDVSFHGSLQIPTPNIDSLAANGVILNNYYVQPICTPSRAALLTGKHPIHLGVQHHVILSSQSAGVPLDSKLMPEYLKKLGYKSHAVGKWHIGFCKNEYTPTYRGFDSYLGFWLPKMDYYDHTSLHPLKNSSDRDNWGFALRDNMRVATEFVGNYSTDVFTDRAIDIINNHDQSKPLFLYLAHAAVHTGNPYALYQSPLNEIMKYPHIKKVKRRLFAGMLSSLDKSIGKIFKTLNSKGLLDNLIFVISTDNGGESASLREGASSNWPLRGSKFTLWEGGIRGTALIWSRLLKKSPRISNQLIHISDWLPTLYNAAGGDISDLGNIYGQNLWTSLSSDEPSPRKEILHNIDPVENTASLRIGKYKLIVGSNMDGKFDEWYGDVGRNNGIFYSDYKNLVTESEAWKVLDKKGWSVNLTINSFSEINVQCNFKRNSSDCQPSVYPCLFNVVNDPCERKNLAEKYPKTVRCMLERLEAYNETAVPLVNQTLDPNANPFFHNFAWTPWLNED